MVTPEDKAESLHIRMSTSELTALKALAEARGENVSSLVRALIVDACARQRVTSRVSTVRRAYRDVHESCGVIRDVLAQSRKPTRAQCNAGRGACQELEDCAALDVVSPARAACETLDRLLGELPATDPKKAAPLLERALRAVADEVSAWVARIERGEL